MKIELQKIQNEKYVIFLLDKQGIILKKAPVGEKWEIATWNFINHPTPASMFAQADHIVFKESIAPLKIQEMLLNLLFKEKTED